MNILTAPSSTDPALPELDLEYVPGCGECGKIADDCDCCSCYPEYCDCAKDAPKYAPCSILVYGCPYCGKITRAVDWEEHPDYCDPSWDWND